MAQDFNTLRDDISYFVGTKLDKFIEDANVELVKEAEDLIEQIKIIQVDLDR